jgi:hypothetical protein
MVTRDFAKFPSSHDDPAIDFLDERQVSCEYRKSLIIYDIASRDIESTNLFSICGWKNVTCLDKKKLISKKKCLRFCVLLNFCKTSFSHIFSLPRLR